MSRTNAETTFCADAALFNMVRRPPLPHPVDFTNRQEGTLTDCVAAVEAAWTALAVEVEKDPAYVLAVTHGRRTADGLEMLKPHIRPATMDAEVHAFEASVLAIADADAHTHDTCCCQRGPGPASRPSSPPAGGLPTPPLSVCGSSSDGRSSSASSSSASPTSTRATTPERAPDPPRKTPLRPPQSTNAELIAAAKRKPRLPTPVRAGQPPRRRVIGCTICKSRATTPTSVACGHVFCAG